MNFQLCTRFVFLWYLYERILRLVFSKKFSQKWSGNLVSATHSVLVFLKCLSIHWNLKKEDQTDEIEFTKLFSVSYFIYDFKNNGFWSVFTPHHVFSIVVVQNILNINIDISWSILGYMFTEFGNFPLYIMYGLLFHPNPKYLQMYKKPVLVMEFMWFLIFRIGVVSYCALNAKLPANQIAGFILQLANIKWTAGMFQKLQAMRKLN